MIPDFNQEQGGKSANPFIGQNFSTSAYAKLDSMNDKPYFRFKLVYPVGNTSHYLNVGHVNSVKGHLRSINGKFTKDDNGQRVPDNGAVITLYDKSPVVVPLTDENGHYFLRGKRVGQKGSTYEYAYRTDEDRNSNNPITVSYEELIQLEKNKQPAFVLFNYNVEGFDWSTAETVMSTNRVSVTFSQLGQNLVYSFANLLGNGKEIEGSLKTDTKVRLEYQQVYEKKADGSFDWNNPRQRTVQGKQVGMFNMNLRKLDEFYENSENPIKVRPAFSSYDNYPSLPEWDAYRLDLKKAIDNTIEFVNKSNSDPDTPNLKMGETISGRSKSWLHNFIEKDLALPNSIHFEKVLTSLGVKLVPNGDKMKYVFLEEPVEEVTPPITNPSTEEGFVDTEVPTTVNEPVGEVADVSQDGEDLPF